MSNKNDINTKITDWLETQGYPLEMLVALAFQKAGIRTSSSDYYIDPDSGESRETDATASALCAIDKNNFLDIQCQIECKLSKDKPWIAFVSEADSMVWTSNASVICSEKYAKFWSDQIQQKNFGEYRKKIALLNPSVTGYGITQAFSSGQDAPFKALMSVVKAALASVRQIDKSNSQAANGNVYRIVFPAIVIDSRLFECRIDTNEQIILNEVETTVVRWRGITPASIAPLVHVITKPALSQFVENFKIAVDTMYDFTHTCATKSIDNRDKSVTANGKIG